VQLPERLASRKGESREEAAHPEFRAKHRNIDGGIGHEEEEPRALFRGRGMSRRVVEKGSEDKEKKKTKSRPIERGTCSLDLLEKNNHFVKKKGDLLEVFYQRREECRTGKKEKRGGRLTKQKSPLPAVSGPL